LRLGIDVARFKKRIATALRLESTMNAPQGNSFLATLGFMTESRWDSNQISAPA
jgi:hypothetical protein